MALPKNVHRADIIAAVHKRGTSLAQLGIAHGKAESTLRAALSKPRTPSNKIIAAFLGKELHDLWPTWFDSKGRPVLSQRTRSRRCASSQIRRQKLTLTGERP